MKKILALFVALASVFAFSAEISRDIVIYGSSPAAISAAVQAKRMGKSAVIVSPETRIGERNVQSRLISWDEIPQGVKFISAPGEPVRVFRITDGGLFLSKGFCISFH